MGETANEKQAAWRNDLRGLEHGLVQVYTGNSERFNFAPLGMSFRAAGQNLRSKITCFRPHALMDGAEDRIPALLEQAAPHLFLVSINGADSHPGKRGWAQLIQPLGQGSYDVGVVLKKVQTTGYQGPIALQCYNIKGDPKTLLGGSMAAWRRLSEGP